MQQAPELPIHAQVLVKDASQDKPPARSHSHLYSLCKHAEGKIAHGHAWCAKSMRPCLPACIAHRKTQDPRKNLLRQAASSFHPGGAQFACDSCSSPRCSWVRRSSSSSVPAASRANDRTSARRLEMSRLSSEMVCMSSPTSSRALSPSLGSGSGTAFEPFALPAPAPCDRAAADAAPSCGTPLRAPLVACCKTCTASATKEPSCCTAAKPNAKMPSVKDNPLRTTRLLSYSAFCSGSMSTLNAHSPMSHSMLSSPPCRSGCSLRQRRT
mmetsp:Transcript_95358/g.269431  ORF Transcript_95358/g.269431 Transcript_95358/m.269431 type:complete len:269 (+) Transcript_95358:17-823(+)